MMYSNLPQLPQHPHFPPSPSFPRYNNRGDGTEFLVQALQQHGRRSSHPAPRISASIAQKQSRLAYTPQLFKGLTTSHNARPVPQPGTTDEGEHMLRRKTPNGTLSAGYDGTPVEWNARPSANKHILMSGSASMANKPYSPVAAGSGNPASFSARINQYDQDKWRAGRDTRRTGLQPWEVYGTPLESGQGMQQWWSSAKPPFVDSMLHQVPPTAFYAGYHQQVPTVLQQQQWSPSMGPTASSAQGPFGPYWPNGAYEPYRPAPVRDSRFDSQFANISLNDPLELHYAYDAREWRSNAPIVQQSTGVLNQHYPVPFNKPLLEGSSPHQQQLTGQYVASNISPRENNHSQWGTPLSMQIQSPLTPNNEAFWQGAAFSNQYVSQTQRPSSVDDTSLHFRDKTLIWAHRVYVNLLATMHQARRHSQPRSHTERRHSQPQYIPKPPKYSSAKASASTEQSAPRAAGRLPLPNPGHRTHLNNDNPNMGLREDVHGHDSSHAAMHQGSFYERAFRIPRYTEATPLDGLHRQQTPNMFSQSPLQYPTYNQPPPLSPIAEAQAAFEMLLGLVTESAWRWTDGMLLGGCLAYGLREFKTAQAWYSSVLKCDPENVEALSNLAATCSSLQAPQDAETYWRQAIQLRPSYFEAIEHLVGLLCTANRTPQAVEILQNMESKLRNGDQSFPPPPWETLRPEPSTLSGTPTSEADKYMKSLSLSVDCPVASGYNIPPCDNGRLVALIHAKGNMLYSIGNNAGASQAFEDAVMVAAGRSSYGIGSLIKHILQVFSKEILAQKADHEANLAPCETILLLPRMALKTAELVFPGGGTLPGFREVAEGQSRRAAISVASNSLLSLAKIYQDGMSASSSSSKSNRVAPGVQDILSLYYLSLSLQPSPSTANNVGILLAGIQQSVPQKSSAAWQDGTPHIAGVVPGSGIALALAYYNYGLHLDPRHAHLYTNLGSLLKDIGQLSAAIKMYEQAVACDERFDIALANLANAVKDQGRIKDAIEYYQRAVKANPQFAEAVCGLANALNSVCSWRGRGGVAFKNGKFDRWHVGEDGMLKDVARDNFSTTGWIGHVVSIVEKQLKDGESWGRGVLGTREGTELFPSSQELTQQEHDIKTSMIEWLDASGRDWEGARVVRLIERATKRLTWQIYQEKYVKGRTPTPRMYGRPPLPTCLAVPSAPTVLPFHTFTCPLTAEQIRKISQRNGLRISCSTLRAPWLPNTVFDPPAPPAPHLNVGYVSSDFNNHPLAHLMQSVFGFHDATKVKAFCYATTNSDNSSHRQQIQKEAPQFYDASSWSVDRLVKQILEDGIHILINLNGYTRGARNEVFAARPAPIQMSFMGFAGTLGAEWCDYILADTTAIPPSTLRPYRSNVDLIDLTQDKNFGGDEADWVYGENIIYARETFFCCDHRQSAPDSQERQLTWDQEQERRKRMRKELFPDLPDDAVILGNFNQLYKIEPTTFRTWLRILERVPKAYLWLLRFPDLGEQNLRELANMWCPQSIASRIVFTDVAPKQQHISRARICDLFLDTPECNAHTTAADILWSGTPLLTLPRYEFKMCSRMAASILKGALPKGSAGEKAAKDLIVDSEDEYENQAIWLANGLADVLAGRETRSRLLELRELLYEGRWTSALFDTRRWVRDLEEAYGIAWERYVAGEGGDIWL